MSDTMHRILFVDDEKRVLNAIRRLLRNKADDWDLLFATSSREADSLIRQMPVDVVVLDVNMPGGDGFSLLNAWNARDHRPDFEVIMLTGLRDDQLKRKALDLGASDLLSKPVSQEDLVARLANSLRLKKYRDALRERAEELECAYERIRLQNRQLEEMATHDQLTKLYNRRYLENKLENLIELARRTQQPLGCIMADIDHFKQVNDTFGHQVGDSALQHVARVLREGVRKTEVVGRFGGEEFMILLPNTGLEEAAKVAEKLRQRVEELTIETDTHAVSCSISLGVAATNNCDANTMLLIRQADDALYRAKENGRNQVRTAREV